MKRLAYLSFFDNGVCICASMEIDNIIFKPSIGDFMFFYDNEEGKINRTRFVVSEVEICFSDNCEFLKIQLQK